MEELSVFCEALPPTMGQDKRSSLKPSKGYFKRTTQDFEELWSLRNTGTPIRLFKVVWCQDKERWLLWERYLSWADKLRNSEFPKDQTGSFWENNAPPRHPTQRDHGKWKSSWNEKTSEESWGRETFNIGRWQHGDWILGWIGHFITWNKKTQATPGLQGWWCQRSLLTPAGCRREH